MAGGNEFEARPTGSQLEFEARVGTWLRRKWKLERLIGVGGMAGVYVGRHKIGRTAAIKLLRPEMSVDPGLLERFEQEALAVNTIGHPAVVQVLDIDEDEEAGHFLVMELLEGETLADRVDREGTLKIPTLLDFVDQTLDALVACHAKGIVHRDIKPENLFIQNNGKLKVLDFGIARMREGVKTVAGTMLGTVAFMPPEQLRGAPVDARADLYALGATMFTVISGRRVHQARGDAQLATQVLTKPAPSLASVAPSAPEHVGWVVDRALAFLPERRYPDARTMRGDVWALERGERPPYAYACNEAGQRPDATSLEPPAKKTRPEGAALPTTDPQMPVFATLPTTDPQLPVFAESPEIEIEPTKPERPVIAEERPPDAPERSAPPESSEAPHSSDAPRISEPPVSEPPVSEPSESEPPESAPPESAPPESDAGPAIRSQSEPPESEAGPARRSPPAKASRTIVGFPRRDPGRPPDDEEGPSSGDEQSAIDGERAPASGPLNETSSHDDEARHDEDEISEDEGPMEDAPARPSAKTESAKTKSAKTESAKTKSAKTESAKTKSAKLSLGWWAAGVVLVAAAAAAGAYAGGYLP